MKKIIRIFFLAAISTGMLNSVQAQRSREVRGGGNGERVSRSPSPARSFAAPSRSMTQRSTPSRTFNNSRNNVSRDNAARNPSRGGNTAVLSPQRNTTVYNTRSTVVTRNGYSGSANRGYYNNGRGYSNSRSYHRYYGDVYGRRTVFMYGPRYRVIPHSFISIRFGGYPYYYNNGFFYGYYNGYYQSLFPPFGLSVGVLPYGYSRFYIAGYPYYYYNGIYYTQQSNDSYQVVDAPMGATVSSLPGGAKSVIVNGEALYESNGTYYKAEQDSNGNTAFTVVGKNGVINNTENLQYENSQPPISNNNMQSPSSENTQAISQLNIGDMVGQLPDGSRLVTINGEQLYETPDSVYLKGESNDGIVQFKVVGK